MSLEFEWGPRKAEANHVRHGIEFEEALTVFRDPLARIFDDAMHSKDEPREIILSPFGKETPGASLLHGSRHANSNHQCLQDHAPGAKRL
jgi:uncharacterized DUF497 family protein